MLLTLLALQCFVTGATAMNGSLASQGSFASPDALDDDVMNGSDVSPIRDNATVPKVYERQLMPLPKLKWISGPVSRHRVHTIVMLTVTLTVLTTLGMMWQPGAAQRWVPHCKKKSAPVSQVLTVQRTASSVTQKPFSIVLLRKGLSLGNFMRQGRKTGASVPH